MSTLTSSRFVEAWRHAGLDDALPALIEAYNATRARIDAEARAAADATERARRGRAEHVAEGKGGKLPAVPEPIDFDRARTVAERALQRDVRALGDSLVAELADAHAGILAEAAELVPLIGSLQTDAQALDRQTSTEAREAWARLGHLWRDRAELLALFGELRQADAVPEATLPAEVRDLADYRLFARPHAGRVSGGATRFVVAGRPATPDALRMATLAADARGRMPGLYTLTEARENLRAWHRAEVAAVHERRQAEAEQAAEARRARARSHALPARQ